MRIDAALPQWDRRERHCVTVAAAPEAVLRAAEEVTWKEVPLFRALMIGRFLRPTANSKHDPVIDWFIQAGFRILDRTADEVLVGAVQGTGRKGAAIPDTVAAFQSFDAPGHIKIAFNFRCADAALSTETRVVATDARSRRIFSLYWFLIRAGSGLIRREWLRAIRRRAMFP